jgi:DNA-binding GntR family transcriptional regulator
VARADTVRLTVAQLPSLTELTSQTGLAVGTVCRAIDVLAREGLVQTAPGRGTFVIRADPLTRLFSCHGAACTRTKCGHEPGR